MKLYIHLQANFARIIITYGNQWWTLYKIAKFTKIDKNKIRRCLKIAKKVKIIPHLKEPWKGPIKKASYNFKKWRDDGDSKKAKRANKYAKNSEIIYLPFVNFCENLHNQKILGKKIKRSADEFIKKFKKNPDYW